MAKPVIVSTVLLACVGIVLLMAAPPAEAKGKVTGACYLGNPNSYEKPGEISLVKVMSVIPEYKKIKDENIKSDDPRYWLLLQKADRKFKAALGAVHKKFGYDLIGEIGFIEDQEVPDITAEVVLEI